MQVNDLVRVIKQPDDMMAQVVNYIGFIQAIHTDDKTCHFQQLKEDGLGGSGTLPIACLQVINDDPQAHFLKKLYDDRLKNLFQKLLQWKDLVTGLRHKAVQEASQLTGVSTEQVEKIFQVCRKYEDEINNLCG